MPLTAAAPDLAALNPHLDDRDLAYLTNAMAAYDAHPATIREGDAVLDVASQLRRVAAIWPIGDVTDPRETRVQLSEGGSTYLGPAGWFSYSGSLEAPRPSSAFTEAGRHLVPVWFFHHMWAKANNAVNVTVPVRLWTLVPTPGTVEYVVRFRGVRSVPNARRTDDRVLTFALDPDDPQADRLRFLIDLAAELRLSLGRSAIDTFTLDSIAGRGLGTFTRDRGTFTITRA